MADVNVFTEQDKDAIESFLSLAFYNGWEQDVKDVCEALSVSRTIEIKNGYEPVSRPDWKAKCGRDKIDEFGGIFWSWLVLQYGDYGTSPRYGWIYVENARKILEIIEEIYEEEQ
jgi:hypothetical protein